LIHTTRQLLHRKIGNARLSHKFDDSRPDLKPKLMQGAGISLGTDIRPENTMAENVRTLDRFNNLSNRQFARGPGECIPARSSTMGAQNAAAGKPVENLGQECER